LKSNPFASRFAAALAGLLLLLTSACSVPLAPGYTIQRQQRQIQFLPGDPPQIRIQGDFAIQNTGNAPLSYLDVKLPPEETYGRGGARAEINGRGVALAPIPEEYRFDLPDSVRIPFDPAWERGKKLSLHIEYTLSRPADPGWHVTLGANEFHLGSRGWSPAPQPPPHFLSPYPKRPQKTNYVVRVPVGFLVSARGALKGRKQSNGEWIYTLELVKGDLPPFVVAGKYQVSPAGADDSEVRFWTLSPVQGDVAAAQKDLQQAWDTMRKEFGPSDRGALAPLIVESAELREGDNVEDGMATGFPGGALVSPSLLAEGVDSPKFLYEVSLALAHDWFGDEIYPPPFAAISMGQGLPEYATIVMSEAREGEAGRQRRIAEYLARYDVACKRGAEEPLGVVRPSDPAATREIARAKAPLFYAALEDEYGEAQVRAGLRQMVTLLRGQEAGINVLRSSLEQSTGKDLAPVFRLWLYQKGIPADFRARYQTASAQP